MVKKDIKLEEMFVTVDRPICSVHYKLTDKLHGIEMLTLWDVSSKPIVLKILITLKPECTITTDLLHYIQLYTRAN